MKLIKDFFCYSFDFVGVVNRHDFIMTMLMVIGLELVTLIISLFSGFFVILLFFEILLLTVPTIALLARRLHDTDRSALNLFWLLFPFVGTVIVIVYTLEKTKYNIE